MGRGTHRKGHRGPEKGQHLGAEEELAQKVARDLLPRFHATSIAATGPGRRHAKDQALQGSHRSSRSLRGSQNISCPHHSDHSGTTRRKAKNTRHCQERGVDQASPAAQGPPTDQHASASNHFHGFNEALKYFGQKMLTIPKGWKTGVGLKFANMTTSAAQLHERTQAMDKQNTGVAIQLNTARKTVGVKGKRHQTDKRAEVLILFFGRVVSVTGSAPAKLGEQGLELTMLDVAKHVPGRATRAQSTTRTNFAFTRTSGSASPDALAIRPILQRKPA